MNVLSDFEQSIRGLAILIFYVISAMNDLVRTHNVKGALKQIADSIKKNALSIQLFGLRTNPQISVGDYVITPGGPAQVVRAAKNKKYGYKTFTVEHLMSSESSIKIEEYIPEEVQLLGRKKELKKKVLQILQGARPGIKVSSQKINKALRNQALQLWNSVRSKTP
jgi:hypothetical protein